MPGNGCFVAAVSCVAGRPPDAMCGKPARDLADYLVSTFDLDPSRTCMIGDRLDTDIALAGAGTSESSMSSLLVLTGVTTAEELLDAAAGADGAPTHAISHLGRLCELARPQ